MIRPNRRLEEFHRQDTRERLGRRSWDEALAVFEGLWEEAILLNPDFPGDWRTDLEPDLSLARVLNELPPAD